MPELREQTETVVREGWLWGWETADKITTVLGWDAEQSIDKNFDLDDRKQTPGDRKVRITITVTVKELYWPEE